ncbi:MAG: ATP phosphoribosyltransferase [Planctomycetota bacterium]|nr:ATP phosphoribosyltransferase [Planctomycetota bacterium]MDI6788081.1 ATP phosphoribosyltransferase [Planctomycetota bacterium]
MLKVVLPKGRMFEAVKRLLEECGWEIKLRERSDRPSCNQPGVELKILKPQNIATLIQLGSHDIGFTGYDWIVESRADVKELLDLGLDPVRIVAAAPKKVIPLIKRKQKKPFIVASEYQNISYSYLNSNQIPFVFVRTFGATEAYPPEDADIIVDNTASGTTLAENRLVVIDVIMMSSTRLIANVDSLSDKKKGPFIRNLALVMESVLKAHQKVLIEMNVASENLKKIIKGLPTMKSPTVSQLYGGAGYAVKTVANKQEIQHLLPLLKKRGATDILVSEISKVIP